MRRVQFIFLMFCGCLPGSLTAQSSNETVILELLSSAMDTLPACRTIEASYELPGLEMLPVTASAPYIMRLASPSVTYKRIAGNQYKRQLALPIVIQGDSTAQRKSLQYEDEISWSYMRKMIRTSDKPFRGEDPSLAGKFLIPAIAILAGTGITTGLFYLRSR